MAKTREIRKRMVAVGTIARITKTMQMIATAKFTAALARAKATKPYTQRIRQLVGEVVSASGGELNHPLITGAGNASKRELLLVISSDRGLCGAYNGNVLRRGMAHVRRLRGSKIEFDLETAGKKAVAYFKFQNVPVVHRHTLGDKPKFEDVEQLANRYISEFTSGTCGSVRVAYMRFISNSRQVPEVMQLLPLDPKGLAEGAGGEKSAGNAGYEFSPSKEELLADLLPTAVKASLFQAFNDAVVSEQIMRMIAMKAATENAKELGKLLRRRFNRARQSQITTELTEIVSGAAALE